jgi:hypothetical protein
MLRYTVTHSETGASYNKECATEQEANDWIAANFTPIEDFTVEFEDVTAKLALEDGIERADKRRAAGSRIISIVGHLNDVKELTVEERATMVGTYSSIMLVLMAGGLQGARAMIAALVADGVIVTAEDKTLLDAELAALISINP